MSLLPAPPTGQAQARRRRPDATGGGPDRILKVGEGSKGMTTNAITYSRVSTLEQAQTCYSLRQQKEALRSYCEAEG